MLFVALMNAAASAADPIANRAAQPMAAGSVSTRVIKTFDFNEEPLGNFEPAPMHWSPMTGRNFPPFQRAVLDKQVGRASPPSMRLAISVGSVGAVYAAGDLQVDQSCDYRITGWVRTEHLDRAAALIRACLLDAAGAPIAGSLRQSSALRSAETGDAWRKVEFVLSNESTQARAIQLSVVVTQPDSLAPSIRLEDTYAGAWFDDITVSRLPRVAFVTRPGDEIVSDDSPQLEFTIQDQDPADLTANIEVFDVSGRRVVEIPLGWANLRPSGSRISIGPLATGWYRAVLTVSSCDGPLCTAERVFIREAVAAPPGPHAHSFIGLILPGVDPARAADSSPFIAWLAPGALSISLTPERGREAILAGWREDGRSIVARVVDSDASALTDFIMRYGPLVDAWQLTSIDNRADAETYALIRRLARPTSIMSTCDALTEPPADPAQRGISVVVPDHLPTARVAAQVAYFSRPTCGAVWAEIAKPRSAAPSAIADWTKRVLLARQAGAERVFVPAPWQIQSATGRAQIEPHALALRTISTLVADRTPIRMLSLDGGAHGILFAHPGADSGTLFAWADDATTQPRPLGVPLGSNIRVFDLEGRSLDKATTHAGIWLTESPVFVSGVQVRELRFADALAIEGPPLEVGRESQTRPLRFKNPTRRRLDATLKLSPPTGWSISPTTIRLSVAPGATTTMPVELRLPRNAPAGTTPVPVEAAIDDMGGPFPLNASAIVGLADLDVRVFWRIEQGRLVIQQLVTNRADHPVNLRAAVRSPNHPRESRSIENLDPGRTAMREFVLDNAAALLDRSVRVTLARPGGAEVANHIIRVESPPGFGHER